MATRSRFQDGSVIVEIIDHPEDSGVLLTVSKKRYDDDAVQVRLSRHVAAAIGNLLCGTIA